MKAIVWSKQHPNVHDEWICPCWVCECARRMDAAIAVDLEAQDREKGPYTCLCERVEFGVVDALGMVAIRETYISGLYKYGHTHGYCVRYDYTARAWSVRCRADQR